MQRMKKYTYMYISTAHDFLNSEYFDFQYADDVGAPLNHQSELENKLSISGAQLVNSGILRAHLFSLNS